MTGPLTYQANQARINDLLRDAASRQRVHEAANRRHAPRSQTRRLLPTLAWAPVVRRQFRLLRGER